MTNWSQPSAQEAVRSVIAKLREHLSNNPSQNVAAPIAVPREDILDAADALQGILDHTPVDCCELAVCDVCAAKAVHIKELGPMSWTAWCHNCGAGGTYRTLRFLGDPEI